jgi:hypothetical protein
MLEKRRLPVEIGAIKLVSLEITVRNKDPSYNILSGILFLTVITRRT